ncbi:collagen alpha-1(I) chain-like [Balaenoptera ricei]|uniref:collagen alpha-1(I) chain-like n=1 Tax=Balaenoptera ricei TaxID=2746895 RepID=UPI0028BEB952|nr:collagen alpha-1(I) chain-like [Balaenoptera ricei]XP_059768084.1 collagen alpha-1(I) chain-like [Balaenoptera ricei]
MPRRPPTDLKAPLARTPGRAWSSESPLLPGSDRRSSGGGREVETWEDAAAAAAAAATTAAGPRAPAEREASLTRVPPTRPPRSSEALFGCKWGTQSRKGTGARGAEGRSVPPGSPLGSQDPESGDPRGQRHPPEPGDRRVQASSAGPRCRESGPGRPRAARLGKPARARRSGERRRRGDALGDYPLPICPYRPAGPSSFKGSWPSLCRYPFLPRREKP